MSLILYGHSDDVLVLEGVVHDEAENSSNSTFRVVVGTREDGGVRMVWRYGRGAEAVWSVELSPLDEGIRIPWGVTVGLGVGGASAYTPAVRVDCAENTPVTIERLLGNRWELYLTWDEEGQRTRH
jgi:hypothetical protein